jgi:hypothetical protein
MPRSDNGSDMTYPTWGPGYHGRLSSVSKLFSGRQHGIEAPIVNKSFLIACSIRGFAMITIIRRASCSVGHLR